MNGSVSLRRLFRWPIAAACGVLAAGTLSAAAAPDRTLTLDESIRLALNNSEAILSTHEDVNIALQRVREAESLFFPKLDLNANWSKFRVQDNTPLQLQPALGPTLIPNSPQENFYSARANIYQTVYEGGRASNTYKQARISYERARSVNDALQVQVSALAKEAFFDLLLAQEKNHLYAQSLATCNTLVDKSTSGPVIERLRASGMLSAFRSESSEAALAEEQSRLDYLRTLNIELNTQVALKGELVTRPIELDLQKLIAWSSQYRSELRQTEYQQELDALGISLSLAERTPTVAFGASYERTGTGLDLQTANWAGTLNVNLPVSISDMFYGWAKVREHRAQYRQATLKYTETADQVQMQVRQAYMEYRFWQNELTPRQDEASKLEALLNQLRQRDASLSERIEAEHLHLDAQLRYEEAIHGHLTALATLERAVGHTLESDQ